MNRKLLSTLIFLLPAVTAGIMIGASPQNLKAEDGQAILAARCTSCHDTGRIKRAAHDSDRWKKTVERMMGKSAFGPKLTDAEFQSLLNHLLRQTQEE